MGVYTFTRRITFLIAVLSLTACASMSEQECLTADWRDRGMRDGQDGEPISYVESHREACGKVGVRPDMVQYRTGHAIGIKEYCTPERALREGRFGHSYQRSCPAELEARFLDSYQSGYRIYSAQQRVNQLDMELRDLQRKLDNAKDDDTRQRVRSQLTDMDSRLRRARDDVYDAERRARY
jgi:hypothetical protein